MSSISRTLNNIESRLSVDPLRSEYQGIMGSNNSTSISSSFVSNASRGSQNMTAKLGNLCQSIIARQSPQASTISSEATDALLKSAIGMMGGLAPAPTPSGNDASSIQVGDDAGASDDEESSEVSPAEEKNITAFLEKCGLEGDNAGKAITWATDKFTRIEGGIDKRGMMSALKSMPAKSGDSNNYAKALAKWWSKHTPNSDQRLDNNQFDHLMATKLRKSSDVKLTRTDNKKVIEATLDADFGGLAKNAKVVLKGGKWYDASDNAVVPDLLPPTAKVPKADEKNAEDKKFTVNGMGDWKQTPEFDPIAFLKSVDASLAGFDKENVPELVSQEVEPDRPVSRRRVGARRRRRAAPPPSPPSPPSPPPPPPPPPPRSHKVDPDQVEEVEGESGADSLGSSE